jgi:hypothetical protein
VTRACVCVHCVCVHSHTAIVVRLALVAHFRCVRCTCWCDVDVACQVHTDPQLMEYLAARDVPIELAPVRIEVAPCITCARTQTEKMIANTSDVQISIGGSFFRLLMDNGLYAACCTSA